MVGFIPPIADLVSLLTNKALAAPLIKRNTTTVLDTDHEGSLNATLAISDESVSLTWRPPLRQGHPHVETGLKLSHKTG